MQSPVNDTRSTATCAREPNVELAETQGFVRGQCETSANRQESNLSVTELSPWERYEAGKRRAIALARSPEHYERLIACIVEEVGV